MTWLSRSTPSGRGRGSSSSLTARPPGPDGGPPVRPRALAEALAERNPGAADLARSGEFLEAVALVLTDNPQDARDRASELLTLLTMTRAARRVGLALDVGTVTPEAVRAARDEAAAHLREAARLLSLEAITRTRIVDRPVPERPDLTTREGVEALAAGAALGPAVDALAAVVGAVAPDALVPRALRNVAPAKVSPGRFSQRGRAAADPAGRSRAALVRELAARLPGAAPALIAKLATLAAVPVTRQGARAILARGR